MMTLRSATDVLFRYGRRFFCEVLPGRTKSNIASEGGLFRAAQDVSREAALIGEGLAKWSGNGRQSYLGQKFLRWVTNSPAADLRRNAAKKLAYGGRQLTPYLGFVGINLLSGHGIVTKKDELEAICEEIRMSLGSVYRAKEACESEEMPIAWSLDDLELGGVIAQGCNAIVHSAKWKEPRKFDFTYGKTENAAVQIGDTETVKPTGRFGEYNLAVKMMFNYDAESNATTIMRVMSKEIVPAKLVVIDKDSFGIRNDFRRKILPPHPHVVDMLCAFTDAVPSLPDAVNLYPNALPQRLYEDGCGRNMTLFMVMQRYDCSLHQYLTDYVPTTTTRLLLLLQLLEGIVYLTKNGVAHRDLKRDNILLDLVEGVECPRLVITDFGSCFSNDSSDLRLHFVSDEIERGGNYALMAPEVLCAEPGAFSMIDYERSDLWAAGALAYEIYGLPNPFYGTTSRTKLDSYNYKDADLPPTSEMPTVVGNLVRSMLRRNPKNRPSPAVAATVCHLLLWGPQSLVTRTSEMFQITARDVLDWLVNEAAISICQIRGMIPALEPTSPIFSCIRSTLLSRVRMSEIEESLKYFE